jgi:ABC-type lipoprotein release transport system permease subunit
VTFIRLAARGLSFYWRTHLAVGAAVAVAAAVLTGALAIGDSVRGTLRQRLDHRLGQVEWALAGGDRFFRTALADEMSRDLRVSTAPLLQMRGLASNQAGTRRVNSVTVLGVDERFFRLSPRPVPSVPVLTGRDEVWLNPALARRLAVSAHDRVVLRIERPESLPGDMPLAPDSERTVALAVTVAGIVDPAQFGDFQVAAASQPALNAFIPMSVLQEQVDRRGRANGLLVAGPAAEAQIQKALARDLRLQDAELEIRTLANPAMLELRTSRVFLDRSVGDAALRIGQGPVGVLAYFVNSLKVRDKVTPYSMVAAVSRSGPYQTLFPPDMQDDQIVINPWLAEDLGSGVGDALDLGYYVLGNSRTLEEKTRSFRVGRIVALEGPALDPNLMPPYPGLADAASCRDWDSGLAVDLKRIRPEDEEYWDRFHGTPKAFVTLEAGRALWANRFGDLTAVRWPQKANSEADLAAAILARLDPGTVGLVFQPVGQQGARAASQGTDFGPLFLGLSLFLIFAAVVLIGLLQAFSVEGRSEQIGTLLALGFTPGSVARLFLWEGGMVTVIGVAVGTGAGLAYTQALIAGLSTVWRGAAGGGSVTIAFFVQPTTLAMAAATSMVTALAVMTLSVHGRVRHTAHQLLSGSASMPKAARPARTATAGFAIACAAVMGAIALIMALGRGNSSQVAGAFFGAGALLLAGGLVLARTLLRLAGASGHRPGMSRLGLVIRNASRRPGRSLAVMAMLACGVFMVVAVGANRQGLEIDPRDHSSGTGGFALYGETAVAVVQDLNSEAGRKAVGFDSQDLSGTTLLQARVAEGDDASCLNLNRAQRPRLLGVDPAKLRDRFTFKQTLPVGSRPSPLGANPQSAIQNPKPTPPDPWTLLTSDFGKDVVGAVGDTTTVFWGLGKGLGDTIPYTDDAGRSFSVRIVGIIDNSVLQGSLLIAERAFTERFPTRAGHSVFLVDTPKDKADPVSSLLSSRMADFGMSITSTPDRLALFNQVENTYLSVFLVLGGLGLVVGTVGLALVVLRNLLERRGEWAMMRAVGFDRVTLVRLAFGEHWGLLVAGLILGTVSSLVAIGPSLRASAAQLPMGQLAVILIAIAASGALWVALAAALVLRGEVWDSLRTE